MANWIPSSAAVHSTSGGGELENLGGLTQIINKLTESQESGQRQIFDCLNNMAQTMLLVKINP